MDFWRVIEVFPRDGGCLIVESEKQDVRVRVGFAVVSDVTNYSPEVRHVNTPRTLKMKTHSSSLSAIFVATRKFNFQSNW